MTPKYDPSNPEHRRIIFGIEKGNGLPKLENFETELEAIKAAGFKVLDAYDKALEDDIPWYGDPARWLTLLIVIITRASGTTLSLAATP